ncbi:DUF1707 SHOCT-like domain-containing protein [Nocardia asteroides]|uniref:DUF1707 SHOCT-like domain-containing protein n=1 Tax=Nocardia asteroides TaxID=1824 RepID=UPI0022B85121|nr:DUF1707 domain-containing protein [Nocardia asteroides]
MRARDLDRVNASGLLDAAYAEGQLGGDEYHDRTARVTAARTIGELRALVDDLQLPAARVQAATEGVRAGTGWRPLHGGPGHYPGRTRARDADRERTRAVLDAAHGEGQLADAEHAGRVELLTAARSLDDLAELVDDLQRAPGAETGPRQPPSYRGRLRIALVTVLALAAATGGFLVTHRDEVAVPPVAYPEVAELGAVEPIVIATPSLVTEEGLAEFLRRYREKFGDLRADEIDLFPEHASIARALPGQPNRLVHYTYRGGFEQDRDVTTRKVDTPVVDLGVLDLGGIGTALADAPAAANLRDGAVSHLSVELIGTDSYARYGLPRGATSVDVSVSTEFSEYGRVLMDGTGRVANVWPFKN